MDSNKIKKILLSVFIAGLAITSCCLMKKANNKIDESFKMTAKEMIINMYQIDSICYVDDLPRSFDEWMTYTFYDYNTNDEILKKMYIKKITDELQYVYILTPETDSTYNIVIRKQENE